MPHLRLKISIIETSADEFMFSNPHGQLCIINAIIEDESGKVIRTADRNKALVEHLNSIRIPMPTKK